jgi:hypothetical protein
MDLDINEDEILRMFTKTIFCFAISMHTVEEVSYNGAIKKSRSQIEI